MVLVAVILSGHPSNASMAAFRASSVGAACAASRAARDLFGYGFVDFFAQSRASQEASFRGLVTDAELERFFEFI